MVAGHYHAPKRQALEKRARFCELAGSRALRQITGNCEQIRAELVQVAREAAHDGGVDATEVKVRDVPEPSHLPKSAW